MLSDICVYFAVAYLRSIRNAFDFNRILSFIQLSTLIRLRVVVVFFIFLFVRVVILCDATVTDKRTDCLNRGNDLQSERMDCLNRRNDLQSERMDCLIRGNELQSDDCLIRGNVKRMTICLEPF